MGGRGGSGDPFRSIECYSISKNSWFFGPEMNSRRRHVGVISVEGEMRRKGERDMEKERVRETRGQSERGTEHETVSQGKRGREGESE